MKTILKGMVIIAAFPAAVIGAFYFWASTSRLSESSYADGDILVADEVPERAAGDVFTIATYNIGFASGLSNNTTENATEVEYDQNMMAIIGALQGAAPDFLATQEVDYGSDRSHHRNQLALLGNGLGLRYRARAFNWDTRYVPFPYWPPQAHYGAVLSGQAVVSAHPIVEHTKVTLIKPEERPFYYNRFYPDRVVQTVTVDIEGRALKILNVHLEAYMQGTREKQALEVAEAVAQAGNVPLILLGDFNAEPPWVTSDATLSNILEGTGLKKAIPEAAYGEGSEERHATFPSRAPVENIDHIFYNDWIEHVSARVVAGAGTGSDHLPVIMTFRIRPATPPSPQ